MSLVPERTSAAGSKDQVGNGTAGSIFTIEKTRVTVQLGERD